MHVSISGSHSACNTRLQHVSVAVKLDSGKFQNWLFLLQEWILIGTELNIMVLSPGELRNSKSQCLAVEIFLDIVWGVV